MKTNNLLPITLMLMLTAPVLIGGGELTPHDSPIKYVESKPDEGTPQAAMVGFILLREQGKLDEAAKSVSEKCPQWLRDGMLTAVSPEHGPIKMDTLSYQLREYTAEKALVNVSFNLDDGTHNGWTRSLIREGERWVLR